jgi:capsular polysaccharide biosynthesis protein
VFWRATRLLEVSRLNLIDLDYYKKTRNFLKFMALNYGKRKVKKIDGSAVWLVDIWAGNYYHWLVEALPKLLSTQLEPDGINVVLPLQFKHSGFHAESLKLLNAQVSYFDEVSERVHFSEVYVPLNVSLGGIANPWFISRLREYFRSVIVYDPTRKRKIYCSRQLAEKRKIVNEKRLTELLITEGFEVVCWEQLSFAQQVQVAAESVFLLALHGAGLTNMMFMSVGSIVVELTRTRENNHCYKYLAHAADLKYFTLQSESLSEDIHHSDCEVDLVKLNSLLLEINKVHS